MTRQRAGRLALALCLAFVAASCGSRRSHAELAAADGVAGPATGASGTALVAGGPTVTGGDTSSAATASTSTAAGSSGPVTTVGPGGSEVEATGAAAGVPTGPHDPIKIAWVGVQTGVPGAVSKDLLVGVKLWVQWVNDHGGASGHQIQLIVADDGGDPARSRAKRQELVDQGVLAFVAQPESLVGASLIDFHEQNRVPLVGGDGAAEFFYDHDMYFPQETYPPYQYVANMAAIAAAVPPGTKVAAILCTELQSCGLAGQVYQHVASQFGLELSYQARTTVAQPDFTAECLSARNSGAEVLIMSMDLPSENRIAQACARQGYHPHYSPYLIDSTFPSNPEFDGLIYASPLAPFTRSDTPGQVEFQQALQAYGVEPTTLVLTGWASGRLLGDAVAAAGDRQTIDRPALLDGLWSLHDDDLSGLTLPLTFAKGQPAVPRTCWWGLTVAGGAWVPTGDGQMKCTEVQP